MRKKSYQRLKAIVNKTYTELTDKIIIHTGNTYVLYNQYAIVRNTNDITVFCRRDESTLVFGKIRHAIAWAILDHNNKMFDAERVKILDQLLSAVEVDKKIHEKLKNRGNIEQHIIYTNKFQVDLERQKKFMMEIDKYLHTADSCHQRGIRNELNRTSRK